MPSPSSALSTLRPDLASSFEEFDLAMDRQGFIATKVLPVMEVAKASGNYGRIPIEQLLSSRDTVRAPGSGYSRGKFTFLPETFATQENGAEEPVDDNQAAAYADYFDAEQVAAARAFDAVLRGMEQRVANLIFNTTTWTGSALTTGVSTPWSTTASATPLANIEAAVNKVYTNSGLWPNTLIITRKAFRYLRNCDEIVSRIKYSGNHNPAAGAITPEVLAELFDLQQILIAGSTKNSANDGQAASLGSLWDDTKAMVCHIMPSNDFSRPTLGRTFHWGEDGSEIGGHFETYRDESIRGEWVRVRNQTQEKVLYTELGHLLTAVTA